MEINNNQTFNARYIVNQEQLNKKTRRYQISKKEILALKKLINKDQKALWNYLQDLETEKGTKLKA